MQRDEKTAELIKYHTSRTGRHQFFSNGCSDLLAGVYPLYLKIPFYLVGGAGFLSVRLGQPDGSRHRYRCSKSGQKVLNCLCELIAFIFSAVILVYGGIQISTLAMGQMTSSLGIPIGIFYIVLPLCGILNMIYTVMNIVEIVKGTEAEGEVK